jgi:hypothetical protein
MADRVITRYRNPPKVKAKHRKGRPGVSLAIVAGFTPLAVHALSDFRTGGLASLGDGVSRRLTGFGTEGSGGLWEPKYLSQGLLPILGGAVIHKIANRFGVNRAIKSAGLGFISI